MIFLPIPIVKGMDDDNIIVVALNISKATFFVNNRGPFCTGFH